MSSYKKEQQPIIANKYKGNVTQVIILASARHTQAIADQKIKKIIFV